MNDVLLSKIVANATDNTWCQAYSTLNFYVALSLERKDSTIASLGKETLEKLQREFFSLDQKTLPQIKTAVKNVIDSLDEKTIYSIVLATLIDNVLYIVIAGQGSVLLKRGDKIGTVASGQTNEIVGFSGKLLNSDILILATNGFTQKISTNTLSSTLNTLNVVEVSENLAPLIHADPNGTEAAVILLYTSANHTDASPPVEEDLKKEEETEKASPLPTLPKLSLPKINLANLKIASLIHNKILLIGGIAILLLILIASMLIEKNRREEAQNEKAFLTLSQEVNQDLSAGIALLSLNKPLALDKFKEAQQTIKESQAKFEKNQKTAKEVGMLLERVNKEIKKIESGNSISLQIFYDPKNDSELKDLISITQSSNTKFISSENGNSAFLDNNGKADDINDSGVKNVLSSTLDDNTGYVLGDSSVGQIKKGSEGKKIFDVENAFDIDIFGENVYILNSKAKTIEKYVPPSFSKSSYLKSGSKIPSTPTSMAIDGSIFVIDEKGEISKFTRGVKEDFSIKGLPSPIGKGALITTYIDGSTLYILDRTNARLVLIGKNSDFKNQYASSELKNATSFAVDEKDKKVYIVINKKVYTFNL